MPLSFILLKKLHFYPDLYCFRSAILEDRIVFHKKAVPYFLDEYIAKTVYYTLLHDLCLKEAEDVVSEAFSYT